MFVECPFCHKRILQWLYESHKRNHTQLKPDGQMQEHITVGPEKRYRGSLYKIPRSYQHPRCGGGTGMPEEIIRSYLMNPLLYNDRSFCTGCGDYIYMAELFWKETGECLLDYNGRLRAGYLQRVYGISRESQREQVVILTPPAEEAVRRMAGEQSIEAPYTLLLQNGKTQSPADYYCNVITDWSPRTHVIALDADDVQVIVPKAQVDSLRGTIIHVPAPPRKGFQICRLYALRPDAND